MNAPALEGTATQIVLEQICSMYGSSFREKAASYVDLLIKVRETVPKGGREQTFSIGLEGLIRGLIRLEDEMSREHVSAPPAYIMAA